MKRYVKGFCESSVFKGGWHILLALLLAAMLLLLTRTFLFMQVEVPIDRSDLGLLAGDRVIVNRTSYGVRFPLSRWWGYHRWGNCRPQKGDMVVYDYPDGSGRISIDRVKGLPGDTLWIDDKAKSFTVVPHDAFSVGSIILPEQRIIGRPVCVTYSVDSNQPFYKLLRHKRLFFQIK